MKTKVLIVDDEKDFCYFIRKTLEASGDFDVITSSDGKEAFGLIRNHKPDLVLLDVMMPGFSGPDIAAEMKEYEKTKNIPIVFVTAVVRAGEVFENNNMIGGWHYLAKPVKTPQLVEMINQLT